MELRANLTMLAILVLIGTVVALLGSSFSQKTSASRSHVRHVFPLDAKDDPSKRLTISWLGIPNYATCEGEKAFGGKSYPQILLERRFNIELQPVFLDGLAYKNKKPLVFAGGKIPDVFIEMDPNFLQRDAQNGFVLEVPYSVIKQYAPTYVRYVNTHAPVAWLYSSWNGKNYGLPTMYITGAYPPPGLWRMDWLRKVGITKVPDTLDEMHEAFRRFRNNDPDGDGKKDTYGVSADMESWWTMFSDIFGAYGAMPFDWTLQQDGTVVWGGVTPEAKETVATLRQWYAEGLIDPDFVTDRMGAGKTMERNFSNGRVGYLPCNGRFDVLDTSVPNSLINNMKKLDPKARLVPATFPAGPRGQRGLRVWGTGGNIYAFSRDLDKRPEVVIRVLKMAEAMAKDDMLAIQGAWGMRGRHWEYNDPAVGPHSGLKMLPPYTDPNAAQRAGIGKGSGFYNMPATTPDLYQKYLPREQVAFIEKYTPSRYALVDAFGKPDAVASAGQYLQDLRNAQLTVYAEIIRGDRPLEDFDQFVKDWYARGGDILTQEANELQQAKLEIYREVGATEALQKELAPAKGAPAR